MATAYVEGNQHGYSPSAFLTYLDSVYVDPNEVTRSTEKLRMLHQKPTETTAHFIPKFEALLMRSGLYVNDASAISYLRFALNEDTRRALIGSPTITDYRLFKERVLQIGSELEGMRWSARSRTPPAAPAWRGDPDRGRSYPPASERMDTRAGRADPGSSIGTPIETRTCYRCDRKGHIAKNYTKGAPKSGPRVNKAGRVRQGGQDSDQESVTGGTGADTPTASDPDSDSGKE